jgi:hypothetical protein
VEEVKELLGSFDEITMRVVRPMENEVAHVLAKEGCENKVSRSWLGVPPAAIAIFSKKKDFYWCVHIAVTTGGRKRVNLLVRIVEEYRNTSMCVAKAHISPRNALLLLQYL